MTDVVYARTALWNVLHDGEITVAFAEFPGELTMFVHIPYLRRKLKPIGDSFVVRLTGLRCLVYGHDDGSEADLLQEVHDGWGPTILHAESEDMPVTVCLADGELLLDYDEAHISLDTGQSIDISRVEAAAAEYWDEWQARADRARAEENEAGRG